MNPAFAFCVYPPSRPDGCGVVITSGQIPLIPSILRPHCKSEDRISLWKGINTPPPATIDNPVIAHIARIASHASLKDTKAYGSGLRKYHAFCDVFSVPESDRLPASFAILHSFALWACCDPDPSSPTFHDGETVYEPVSSTTASKYLSAVRAWHIIQGWPPPLTDADNERISFSLRGLARIQGSRRKRPPRPPVSLAMLLALHDDLDLTSSFDAAVWAAAACGFFGLMRMGELTVQSRSAFKPERHITRQGALFGRDDNDVEYAKLTLPSAKTANPGETQDVFLATQGRVSPLDALRNMARVTPAGPNDPLFSWRDSRGEIRPLTRSATLARINNVLGTRGWGSTFGHSFRIGGASFYMAKGVNPEIIRIVGRWRSLAYELYIRAFEQVVGHHVGNLT